MRRLVLRKSGRRLKVNPEIDVKFNRLLTITQILTNILSVGALLISAIMMKVASDQLDLQKNAYRLFVSYSTYTNGLDSFKGLFFEKELKIKLYINNLSSAPIYVSPMAHISADGIGGKPGTHEYAVSLSQDTVRIDANQFFEFSIVVDNSNNGRNYLYEFYEYLQTNNCELKLNLSYRHLLGIKKTGIKLGTIVHESDRYSIYFITDKSGNFIEPDQEKNNKVFMHFIPTENGIDNYSGTVDGYLKQETKGRLTDQVRRLE